MKEGKYKMIKISKKAQTMYDKMERMYKVFCEAEKTNNTEIMNACKSIMLENMREYDNMFNVNHKYQGVNY